MGATTSSQDKKEVVLQNNGSFYSVDIHWPTIFISFAMMATIAFLISCCCLYIGLQHRLRRRWDRRRAPRETTGFPMLPMPQASAFSGFPPPYDTPMLRFEAPNSWNTSTRWHGAPRVVPTDPHPRFEEIGRERNATPNNRPSDV